MVTEIDKESHEMHVNFLHPHGPNTSFFWPEREDSCWVPIDDIFYKIGTPLNISGRSYTISNIDWTKMVKTFYD